MRDREIEDRGLVPGGLADPTASQAVDAILCPECQSVGALSTGEVCLLCEGTGNATGRTGG